MDGNELDESRIDALTSLIAKLRERFPFQKDVCIADICYSPEWCLEVMISSCGWRGIESAPKSEFSKAILCDVDGRVGEGDISDGKWVWRYNEKLAFPTHWMPLPEPPNV